MDCVSCKLNKISPQTMPYGGFLCARGHMQCEDCNVLHKGRCCQCRNKNDFVFVILKANSRNVAVAEARMAPPAMGRHYSPAKRPILSPRPNVENRVFTGKNTIDEKSSLMGQQTAEASSEVNLSRAIRNRAVHLNLDSSVFSDVFVFQQDPNNLTTEMNLTDSTLQQPSPRNAGLKNKSVKHYLRTHEPLATYDFPSYHQARLECNGNIRPTPPYLQSISRDLALHKKFGNQDYAVMQATVMGNERTKNVMDVSRQDGPGLDLCVQKLHRTYQEDAEIPQSTYLINPEKDKYKILTKSRASETSQPHGLMGQEIQKGCKHVSNNDANDVPRLLNVRRAIYHSTEPLVGSFYLSTSHPALKEPPPAQFETITSSSSVLQELIGAKSKLRHRIPGTTQEVAPLQCPESECSALIFISDFKKHFKADHSQLPKERIKPLNCKNLLLDPRFKYGSNNYCHKLYLLKDKIDGRNSSLYKYFLPLIVMSSRVSVSKRFGNLKWHKSAKSPVHYLVVWVTGIVPEGLSISVTLTVWSRTGTTAPCHMVYSGDIYSIRKSQKTLDVIRSGRMLMISAKEVSGLTNKCREMLHVQLMINIGKK